MEAKKSHVKFHTTENEKVLVKMITARAKGMLKRYDETDMRMDLIAVHSNDVKLDFKKLLYFDDFNFLHDVAGIRNNINRHNGKLMNHFLPRCSK